MQTLQERINQKRMEAEKATILANTKAIAKKSLGEILRERLEAKALLEKQVITEDVIEDTKEAILDEIIASELTTQAKPIEATGTVVEQLDNGKLEGNIYTEVKESLKQKIARLVAERATKQEQAEVKTELVALGIEPTKKNESFSLSVMLNEKQQSAVDMVSLGASFVLIGAAGSGKTTSEREICNSILKQNNLVTTSFKVTKDSRVSAPSIAVCAFTRRATRNSRNAIFKSDYLRETLANNVMTIHSLLEFEPVTYYDKEKDRDVFRFEPQKTRDNPLELTHLIIEEASLVGLDLWTQLYDALPTDCQLILVGDINQLPPVFGASILHYGISLLPTVELTQIYRQAEGSPIIDNAHHILNGESIVPMQNNEGKVAVITGKNAVSVGQHKTSLAIAKTLEYFHDTGIYNEEEDMILCPYNVQDLGTISMNYHIAEFLSKNSVNKPIVYEIITGFSKLYLAEGDKVMYNKHDYIVTSIAPNHAYVGKLPKAASTSLSRWGQYRLGEHTELSAELDKTDEDTYTYDNFSLDSLAEDKLRVMQASHSVVLTASNGFTVRISGAGDFSEQVFSLGYALTCHKAQGSEWNKVFIILHKDQLRNLSREWLYTAVTRARNEVYIFAKEDVLTKTIGTQRVKGKTLRDKIEYFNNGMEFKEHIVFPNHTTK
jgi:ATP-dependent exoDNAse (exonuclease V) alpha subunit